MEQFQKRPFRPEMFGYTGWIEFPGYDVRLIRCCPQFDVKLMWRHRGNDIFGMQTNKSNPGPIPPRWLHCPRKSTLIGGKFLVFKTPLDSRYDAQIPEECRFDVNMLFGSVKGYGVKLGLFIDLTNTTRFYDKKAIEAHECIHYKLNCKGHGETPSPEQTDLFINFCHNFIRKNPLSAIDKLLHEIGPGLPRPTNFSWLFWARRVGWRMPTSNKLDLHLMNLKSSVISGVHCTHGFNRSGFLIIAYIVKILDCSLDAAINMFSSARPPGIYKQDYIDELYRRYGDDGDAPMPAPNLPDWCTESDDRDDDGNLLQDSSRNDSVGSNGSQRHNKREINKKNAQFMDGQVKGVVTVTNPGEVNHVQKTVQEMCKWESSGFPGSQPVSMDVENIKMLTERPYKVSWKADGTRYMMLIEGPGKVYMIDRDNQVYQVSCVTFPRRKEPTKHIFKTLLDGEMIIDQVEGRPVPRFLIYDIIKFEDQDVGMMNFEIRLLCISKEIIGPRNECIVSGKLNKTLEPFSIRAKHFWDITCAKNILDGKFAQEVSHEVDGLIFQPVDMKYPTGRSAEMLKWKPPSLNSVDFKLVIKREQRPGMLPENIGQLFVGQLNTPFATMKCTKALKEFDNKIIECNWDPTVSQWKFMRQRTDKSFPNSFTTAQGVIGSIRKPVTKELLYDIIDFKRWRKPGESVDSDLMPPPAKIQKR